MTSYNIDAVTDGIDAQARVLVTVENVDTDTIFNASGLDFDVLKASAIAYINANKLVPKDKEDIYRKQLDHEIYVLESTNNVDYMLVQYDTVNWARKNGILVGCGRGSAGGCLVLYLLGITLIDPIKYDLLFERFLLPERAGLYPSDVTIIGDDVDSNQYIEVTLENHKTYKIDKDAQLLVKRAGMDDPIVVYADELQTDDDIQFDNRDLLFTLNEI